MNNRRGRKNTGNEEWQKLKTRQPEPPVKLRLGPEDALARRGSATDDAMLNRSRRRFT